MITFKNPWEEKGMYYSDWFDTTDSGALHRMGQVSDNDITIEGPFDSKGQSLKFVSRKNSYSYVVTINKMPSKYDLKSIKWAVSYDDNQPEEAYYLFKGGIVEGNKVRVDIQIAKGENSFRVYAYFGALPSLRASVNVFYKKVVTFFIGGAGDKEPYLGEGPTNLIEDKVRSEFNKLSLPVDYSSYYLSYKDAYKDEILSKIIPKIPNKEGSLVNIIGHSLGGWNGAHLSQILTDAGYNVDFLATLDPVGTKVGVTVISDIYWNFPTPKYNYWVDIYTDPDSWDTDDYVAWGGGQWIPEEGSATIQERINAHHREVGKMFQFSLKNKGISISDFLLHFINLYLDSK